MSFRCIFFIFWFFFGACCKTMPFRYSELEIRSRLLYRVSKACEMKWSVHRISTDARTISSLGRVSALVREWFHIWIVWRCQICLQIANICTMHNNIFVDFLHSLRAYIWVCVCVFQIRISILHLRFIHSGVTNFRNCLKSFCFYFFSLRIFSSRIFQIRYRLKKESFNILSAHSHPKAVKQLMPFQQKKIRKSTAVFDSYVVDVWYSFSADTFFFLHRTCDTCTSRLHTWLLTLC